MWRILEVSAYGKENPSNNSHSKFWFNFEKWKEEFEWETQIKEGGMLQVSAEFRELQVEGGNKPGSRRKVESHSCIMKLQRGKGKQIKK